MESCLLICRTQKDKKRKNKIIFINAPEEVARVTAYSYLDESHINKIFRAYKDFKDVEGFTKVVSNNEVLKEQNANLTISRYVPQSIADKFDVGTELSNYIEKSKDGMNAVSKFNAYITTDTELESFRKIIKGKESWARYKFKDLVNNLNKSESRPLDKGLEKFVGLENLSSETFEIQGHGLIKNGTSFTKRFFAGNVLFSKRRSYLKKVAVADFDGICSGDILVFEVKKEKYDILLPKYLPYIVRSNDFIHFATYTSAGSLSPRTKWKEMADYEFGLPTIEEQEKIIETLEKFEFMSKQLKNEMENFQEKLEHLRVSIANDSIT